MTVLPSALRFVERAHDELGLTYRELADALHADESTLHRWRNGDSTPSPVFMDRLDALGELLDEIQATFRDLDAARRWLERPVEALDEQRPRDVLLQGKLERLTLVLRSLNLGLSV